ncbi:MAG: hypothetical protein GWN81_24615, partial [Phycisphaerae bacterium]|nr:hypothetical protein [Phycisphaerae bacterium]NIW50370.1 hypothetical protein [Gammaproteobacteria bacterium]
MNHVFSLHNTDEIQQLLKEAGFDDIEIQANTKMLYLPTPKEFLWQYVYSTPLAAVVSEADERSRIALENEV